MKLKVGESLYISDNSKECDSYTLFLSSKNSSKYVDDALKNGAKGVIDASSLKRYIDIEDVKVVGVTGTNGKTTTTALIYSLLLDLGYKAALSGSRGFFINEKMVEGRSLTTVDLLANYARVAKAKSEGCSFYITEVSSHAIVQKRLEGIEFELKVLTNITSDHLDYHKTLQNYIDTKNSFFSDNGAKLINKDEKRAKYSLKNIYTYGIEEGGSFSLRAYRLSPRVSGVIEFGSESAYFDSNMIGRFNLSNIVAAISATKLLTDAKLEDICSLIENFGGVEGRVEIVNDDPLVVIDFAHTEDGMRQIFESFLDMPISVVFGAGGDRDRSKRPFMGMIADKYASRIYLTNDNPRFEEQESIIEDIMMGISHRKKVSVVLDRKEAIYRALDELPKGSVLLILGKGDEEYIEIKGKKIPFKDKEVVKDYFNSRA